MRPVLLDTSLYISALRRRDVSVLSLRRLGADSPLWLSAVVLEELYAGTSAEDRNLIERLEREFDKLGRILLPALSDWAETGRLLSRLGAKYGYEEIGRGRLTNDALIAMSARRQGITVITANERDYGLLAEFRPFQWRLAVV